MDCLPGVSAGGGGFVNINPPQDVADLLDSINIGDRFIFTVGTLKPIQISGDMASGPPTMAGDLTINIPINLSGSMASGAPTMGGDISLDVIIPLALSGSIASGAPTMRGDLTIAPSTSLNVPTNLSVTTPNDGEIYLSWDWNQGDFSDDNLIGLRFQVQYKHKKEVRWTEDGTVEFGRREHTIRGLATAQPYNWRLRAVSLLEDGYISPWVSGEKTSSGDTLSLITGTFNSGLRSWSPSIPGGVSASQDAHCIPFRSSWAIDGIIEITDFTGSYVGSNLNFDYLLKTLRAINGFKLEGSINVYSEPFLDLEVRYRSVNPGTPGGASGPNDNSGTLWYTTNRVYNPDQTSPYSSHTWEFETPRRNISSGTYIWIRFVGSVDGDDINTVKLRLTDETSQSLELLDTVTNINLDYQVLTQLDEEDESDNRLGSFAKYFTFELTGTKSVTIDMEGQGIDTYLYLLDDQRGGSILEENDDIDADSNNYDSRITRQLDAGTYTVEATTHGVGSIGTFILRVSD